MGIIKAFTSSLPYLADEQWKEIFYCDSMGFDVLLQRGQKRVGAQSTNTRRNDEVITNGSLILVNEGQAVIVTSMGKVVDVCTEPGEHVFEDPNRTTGPAQFFRDAVDRFSYGGGDIQPVVHRLYYVNIMECMGNTFSTTTPVPLRITDPSSGLDMDSGLMVSGVFSYRVIDVVKFYKLLVGNISGRYYRSNLNQMITNQMLSSMNVAVSRLAKEGVRPSDLPQDSKLLGEELQKAMNEGWMGQHGLSVTSIAISELHVVDSELIKDVQRTAMLKDPAMAAAALIEAKADSMRIAAGNPAGFAGMAAARPVLAPSNNSDMVAYLRGQGAKPKPQGLSPTWTCVCGTKNTGRFCTECGRRADGGT